MASEKQKAPAYQWYPKDYDTDEAVKLMTYEQEGIYRRLLDHQALHGSIPADPHDIAMLVPKIPAARFLTLWPRIAGKFAPQGDRLVNGKLERVKANTSAFQAGKSAAGKASVDARRAKSGSAQPAGRSNRRPNTTPNGPPNRELNTVRTEDRTDDRTAAEPASALASAKEHEDARAEVFEDEPAVLAAFRRHWKAAYGYDCSLILSALEYMQLEQQIAAHGERRLTQAIGAYFAADDPYVRRAKHPLALFLRDPLKFLAKDAVVSARPKGCRHTPPCADDAAHTKRHLADLEANAS